MPFVDGKLAGPAKPHLTLITDMESVLGIVKSEAKKDKYK